MDGLTCLNCQKPVDPTQAKIFAATFVCPTCFAVAARLKERLVEQLKYMVTALDETIRLAIIDHKLLSLIPTDSERATTKKEVLEAILQMKDARDSNAPRVTTPPKLEERKQ
jgi:recombinational DNA repair protein (RecF pathway)